MEWRLKGIQKVYGKKIALKHFSFVFHPGIYALLGPNGAGKSTLMNILAGVLTSTHGEVLVDNQRLSRREYQDRIGYLPQKFGCYDAFTGRDMLYYMAALKGMKKGRKLDYQVRTLAGLFELTEDLDRKMREYSGGMKQRIGIIQAFLGEPELVILDEPTAGLDPRQRLCFRQMLGEAGMRKTVLLSTHILSDVEALADTIMIMREGELVAVTSEHEKVEDLYMHYFSKSER